MDPFSHIKPFSEIVHTNNSRFIVCGMFTKNYSEKANKFLDSINKFKLSNVIYEVPDIHSSISYLGKIDSQFNKPTFIGYLLNRYKKNILYVDVDCLFEDYPDLIHFLSNHNFDFGIFNWLSKERNDAYSPVDLPGYEHRRFYRLSHGIDMWDESQLICSGAVQFWADTKSARNLLNDWNNVIRENPNTADDISLNFAYNNKKFSINSYWLPKKYARYAFWIFDKPIINHPDMPHSGVQFQKIALKSGEFLVNQGTLQKRQKTFFIQPNAFLDLHTNDVVLLQNGIFLKIGVNTLPFYI